MMELLQLNLAPNQNNASTNNNNNKLYCAPPAATTSPLDDYDLEEYIAAEFLDVPAADTVTGELDRFLASLYAAPYRSCETVGPSTPFVASANAPEAQRPVKRGRPRKDSDPDTPLPTSTSTTSTTTMTNGQDQSRRERNRLAAQRCRERRLAKMEELESEIEQLKREKEAMMAELIRLGARPPC